MKITPPNPAGADNNPKDVLPEPAWQALIIASAAGVILFSVYCLSHGITIIFMHLYYFPLVLLAYHYRYRGFVLSLLLALTYLGLVVIYYPEQAEITGALYRFLVFVAIAAVIAYLSERLAAAQKFRKQAEDTLRDREEQFSIIFHNQQTGLLIVDAETHMIEDANTAALAMIGASREEVMGKICHTFVCPAEKGRCPVTDLGKEIDNSERILLTNDGGTIPVLKSVKPVMIKGRQYLIESFIDITDRKRTEEELQQSRQLFADIIGFLPDATLGIDRDGKVIAWNRAMEQLSGIPAQDMLGKGDYQYTVWAYGSKRPILIDLILHPDENFTQAHYKGIQREGNSLTAETELARVDGRTVALSLVAAPLFNGKGEIVGAIESMRDITEYKKAQGKLKHFNEDLERKIKERTESLHQITSQLQKKVLEHETAEKRLQESLDEKVILLREIHHRVKNNLQILISLINLQSRNIPDGNVQAALKETQNRVRAMSLVYEKLYQSDSLTHIDFSDYIRYLVTQLFGYYGVDSRRVALKLDIKKILVNINTAIPIGLMINEMASNSLKHGFPDGREGDILIAINKESPMLFIIYTDNGVGIPRDLDWRNAKSLGLRLLISLVEQLSGTIELDRTSGTKFTIVVKEKE